jgi:hypothetical protein
VLIWVARKWRILIIARLSSPELKICIRYWQPEAKIHIISTLLFAIPFIASAVIFSVGEVLVRQQEYSINFSRIANSRRIDRSMSYTYQGTYKNVRIQTYVYIHTYTYLRIHTYVYIRTYTYTSRSDSRYYLLKIMAVLFQEISFLTLSKFNK